jgi:steroid delta-isomerase-like uncharacterized protein
MTREDIAALLTRRDAAWRRRDAALLAADHAADGVVISPTGGVLEGREDIERIYRLWFSAFPDYNMDRSELLIDGDRAVVIGTITGTHSGDFFGLAATGRKVQVAFAFVYEFRDGLIAHERRILDFTGVLVQVGVLKTKPAAR